MQEDQDGEVPMGIAPEMIPEATNSVVRNERLDGTIPSSRSASQYEPIRARLQSIRWRPYDDELYVINESEETREEHYMGAGKDQWRLDAKRRKLFRLHGDPRFRVFHPQEVECPVPLRCLTSYRKTVQLDDEGNRKISKGDWRKNKTAVEECGPR